MGSSPLTQGKLIKVGRCRLKIRLIPAHAGKTEPSTQPAFRAGAHPRSRGENLLKEVPPVFAHGLIPAHAGKTRPPTRPSPPKRVHPRSRGENIATAERPRYDVGSSPLTRGKRWEQNSWTDPVGLIPAHAGKTAPPAPGADSPWAHPRSRGENAKIPALRRADEGSSPLTRGKR